MNIIAVDFDGTLCESKWPDIGTPHQFVINELIKRQADGAKLILWTCREGDQLQAAVMWCLNHGLKFDAVNDNLEENKEQYGNNSRKVWATEYWDDKNTLIIGDGGFYGIYQAGPGIPRVKFEKHVLSSRSALPHRPGEIAVASSLHQSAWERLKAWWKKWRCE